jgi:hypothetical protein
VHSVAIFILDLQAGLLANGMYDGKSEACRAFALLALIEAVEYALWVEGGIFACVFELHVV